MIALLAMVAGCQAPDLSGVGKEQRKFEEVRSLDFCQRVGMAILMGEYMLERRKDLTSPRIQFSALLALNENQTVAFQEVIALTLQGRHWTTSTDPLVQGCNRQATTRQLVDVGRSHTVLQLAPAKREDLYKEFSNTPEFFAPAL